MAPVDVKTIKQLREKTKAGVTDCRKALEETKGDMKKAAEWLRQKGINSSGKELIERRSKEFSSLILTIRVKF